MKYPTYLPVFPILELHLEETFVGQQEGRGEINQWGKKVHLALKKNRERNTYLKGPLEKDRSEYVISLGKQ